MLGFFQKSLRNKLLVLLISIGFLPFLTLLVYMIFLSETKLVKKIVFEQLETTKSIVKLITNHLDLLTKEISFLSSLDLMDDLLVDDLDKRVSRLLIQKAEDLNLDIRLISVTKEGVISASSEVKQLLKSFDLKRLSNAEGSYIEDKNLYVYSKIYASFDKQKELGFLVLEYNLENLDIYLTHQDRVHSYIVDKTGNIKIGENLDFNLSFTKEEGSVINSKHVIVYKQMLRPMSDYYIVYAVDKSIALVFLYDFIRLMLYISVLIFILLIYISVRYSRDIVKPIEHLTQITKDITKTQNYSVRLITDSKDEIALLANSFNEMIDTTSSALLNLEKENKLRVKRFTNLIDVFNIIIQTKSEEECIRVSVAEIKKLTPTNSLYFLKDKNIESHSEFIELYVSDFEHNTKIYFGSIILEIEKFEDKYERNFYNSIASMITLQLDKIRLIQRRLTASNAKSAFISNMSHELRTPLNAIIGSSQYMIAYEKLSDDSLDTVGSIESSAQYLLGMINEVLDVAKIEAGVMEVNLQPVSIEALVESCYDMLSPLASDKDLKIELDSQKMDTIMTDPKAFQQIVINLLSNAIKFTKEGSISLKLFSDSKNIYVSVKDNGIGIDSRDMETLFNDFTQIRSDLQKSQKGTGLGLSLSKKMARLLDGDVTLKSEGLGHGTEALFFIKR